MPKKSRRSLIGNFQNASEEYCRSSLDIHLKAYLPVIAGENDRNFEAIKKAFDNKVFFTRLEKRIDVYASDKDTAERAVNVLRALKQSLKDGGREKGLSEDDVRRAIRKALPVPANESSPPAHYPVTPRNPMQEKYLETIASKRITFGIGPAGTGKTYLAVAMACQAFESKRIKKIILTRPVVEAGEKMGYLPGDFMAKIDPYMRPLYDALTDFMTPQKMKREIEAGNIEIVPFAYMRGRTLKDAFIILDEAQNTTPEQMKMFLTRMQNSIVVVNGDKSQCDLPVDRQTGQVRSGLNDALEILSEIFPVVTFKVEDVVRDPDVQRVVEAYEARDRRNKSGHSPSPH
jgi:phosphate starvation-inducible PhoH-like protein